MKCLFPPGITPCCWGAGPSRTPNHPQQGDRVPLGHPAQSELSKPSGLRVTAAPGEGEGGFEEGFWGSGGSPEAVLGLFWHWGSPGISQHTLEASLVVRCRSEALPGVPPLNEGLREVPPEAAAGSGGIHALPLAENAENLGGFHREALREKEERSKRLQTGPTDPKSNLKYPRWLKGHQRASFFGFRAVSQQENHEGKASWRAATRRKGSGQRVKREGCSSAPSRSS